MGIIGLERVSLEEWWSLWVDVHKRINVEGADTFEVDMVVQTCILKDGSITRRYEVHKPSSSSILLVSPTNDRRISNMRTHISSLSPLSQARSITHPTRN